MLERYYRINSAVGISINIRPDGIAEFNACQIIVEGNNLSFEKKITGLTDVNELHKYFADKTFLAVNLTGKGVLHKKVDRLNDINQNNFSKILTNADLEDFYIQNVISGESSFVSAVRKPDTDKWIDQLKALGYIPLMLTLGPFPVENIITQLNLYDQNLDFDGHSIERNEQLHWIGYKFDSMKKSPFPIKVESEILDEKLIIAYACAFQLLLAPRVPSVHANVLKLEQDLTSVISNKKFQFRGSLILAAIFFMLLTNFGLYSYLNNANRALAAQVNKTAQSSMDIQSMNDQVKQKESLLEEIGWESGINKSLLVDQIASLVPDEISLSEIAVNPVDEAASRVQKTLVFFNRQISITGASEKIIPVNEWVARLKTKTWVKNIQLDSYTYNNELNTGQFTVIIYY